MKKDRTHWRIVGGAVVGMAIIVTSFVLFNFFPEKVGTYRTVTDHTTFTPVLAPAFSDHLFDLNLWWGLSFALNFILIWARRWTPALRLAEVTVGLFGACVLARLVINGPFLTPAGGDLVRFVLALVVLGMFFDAIRKLIKLVNGRWLIYGPDPARQ